ncbi:MAG: PP2C family protein-serine/threonine phosphatase [Candidatus Zixiibacteriota bacterium]
MTVAELEHFRDVLVQREENLEEWLAHFEAARRNEAQRVRELIIEIRAALSRVENGGFGECNVCHGDVETQRLEIQPIRQVCLDCISAAERSELEQELSLAGQIHRALLPQQIAGIPGLEVAVRSLAARVVGGDYYDFLPSTSSGWTRIVIGDIMGKGLPAGLVMSNLQGALRILAEEIEPPAALVTRLNRWLCHNIPVTKFVSLACVSVGPPVEGIVPVRYTNAGHCPPILLRADGDVTLLDATVTVIGVHEDFTYTEGQTALAPGDWLVLYTDGVTEAPGPDDDLFDESRLMAFVRRHRTDAPGPFLDHLIGEVSAFSGCSEFADDLTVIALHRPDKMA